MAINIFIFFFHFRQQGHRRIIDFGRHVKRRLCSAVLYMCCRYIYCVRKISLCDARSQKFPDNWFQSWTLVNCGHGLLDSNNSVLYRYCKINTQCPHQINCEIVKCQQSTAVCIYPHQSRIVKHALIIFSHVEITGTEKRFTVEFAGNNTFLIPILLLLLLIHLFFFHLVFFRIIFFYSLHFLLKHVLCIVKVLYI